MTPGAIRVAVVDDQPLLVSAFSLDQTVSLTGTIVTADSVDRKSVV